jgi:TRAP-type C4-dicarboxylate transport system permease small subunit
MLSFVADLFASLLSELIPKRYERPLVFAICALTGVACLAVAAYFLFQTSFRHAEPLLAWPALLFAAFGLVCFAIAKRGKKS